MNSPRETQGSSILASLLANFAGAAGGLVSLLFNVAYLRLLGNEGYGLLAFYSALALLASVFDLGLTQTAVREIARRTSATDRREQVRSVVCSLLCILCGIGLAIGLLTAASAEWLATSWLGLRRMLPHEAALAIATMGGLLALSLPTGALNAVMRGLDRQVLLNAFTVSAALVRGAATVLVLTVLEPAPTVFFAAQLVLSAGESVVLVLITWRQLPPGRTPAQVGFRIWIAGWRFSVTVWLSYVVGQAFMLIDRIVLSAMLPLDAFGLYSIALTMAMTLYRLAQPIYGTFFPRFAALAELTRVMLARSFHSALRLAVAIVVPAGLLAIVHAHAIMLLVLGKEADARALSPVFALLAASATLGSLAGLQHTLQMAAGAPWIALRVNLIQGGAYFLLLVFFIPRYGIYAPAMLSLIALASGLFILTAMSQRFILPASSGASLARAAFLPAGAATAVIGAGAILLQGKSGILLWSAIAVNYVLAVAAALSCLLDMPSRHDSAQPH